MVKKVGGEYYLDRCELIEYLIAAYSLKWCNTRWINACILISYENTEGHRSQLKLSGYKLKSSRKVRFRKIEIDLQFSQSLS